MRAASLFLIGLVSAILLAGPADAGLKQAAIRLPENLAAAERLAVKGRQGWRHLQTLMFGPYSVESVNRSVTRGSDLHVSRYEGNKRTQTFSFIHREIGEPVFRVGAAADLARQAVDVGIEIEFESTSGFVAELQPVDPAGPISVLELKETMDRPLSGTLTHGREQLRVLGTNHLAGTPLPLDETTGYVFEWQGNAVAAVEVINDGAVWFSPQLGNELRQPVSAAIAALLLLEELRTSLPD